MSPAASPPRVVYIAGISFCGSTLLSIVLDSHPDIISIGEMGPANAVPRPDYECTCGNAIIDCPFFTAVGERMTEMGVDFDVAQMRLRHNLGQSKLDRLWYRTITTPGLGALRDLARAVLPSKRRELSGYVRRNEAFYRAALEVSGKTVFVDATKQSDRIPLLRRMDVDLKVIHLVRDPRSYLVSARKRGEKTADQAAREFNREHAEIEYHLKKLPRESWMRINYETVCADPQHWFSEMSMFMGVGPMEMPEDYRAAEFHVVGHKSRLDTSRTTIELIEKWRDELDQEDLAAVGRVAGPLARRYGYDI